MLRNAACTAVLLLSTATMAAEPTRGFPNPRADRGARSFTAGGTRTPRPSGGAVDDADAKWARENLKKRDMNGNGQLDGDEVSSDKYEKYDRNGDRKISYEELLAYSRGATRKALAVGREATTDGRRSQRLWTAADKLPDGLPSWFRDRDKNGDGQVAMHEYSRRWDTSTLRRYEKIDANGDGLITAGEAIENR